MAQMKIDAYHRRRRRFKPTSPAHASSLRQQFARARIRFVVGVIFITRKACTAHACAGRHICTGGWEEMRQPGEGMALVGSGSMWQRWCQAEG